jgi:hypothetical protein
MRKVGREECLVFWRVQDFVAVCIHGEVVPIEGGLVCTRSVAVTCRASAKRQATALVK